MPTPSPSSPSALAARSVGAVLGAAARVASAVRPAPKPLHPRGGVVRGVLRRHGSPEETGVPLLDRAGTDDVLLRTSRAAGLPAPLPDVHGLAVRVPTGDGMYGDLLFATTGLGRVTRFLLLPTWSGRRRTMSTLLPYATPTGPVVLAATAAGERDYAMLWARPRGSWHRWGEIHLEDEPDADALLSFDPVANTVTGLVPPGWVRWMRAPAYRAARRSRR